MNNCIRPAHILFPAAGIDLSKWAVIACDQYTSQRDYWQEVEQITADSPSTLHITLPEVYLEDTDVNDRISAIHANMEQYLSDGILTELPAGMMLLERRTGSAHGRRGLVMEFDLEAYDYNEGSSSLIRPTEKTVVERIPPRLAVRRGAPVELPHIMLLIDDPDRTVIEPLFDHVNTLQKKYDVDLMQNGGHLDGWFIPAGELTAQIADRLERLSSREAFNARYGLTCDQPLLPFAVGDGNHSMATAKANWEEIKQTLSPAERVTHPARWVLAELVNIHDESLEIEGIHRVLFGVDPEAVLAAARGFFSAHGANVVVSNIALAEAQSFPIQYGDTKAFLNVMHSPWALPVATLQNFLDNLLPVVPDARIDYIHGLDALAELSAQPGSMGFQLPDPSKTDLFRGVILDGVLPRKTFSMGEAHEKRFYMEARKITL